MPDVPVAAVNGVFIGSTMELDDIVVVCISIVTVDGIVDVDEPFSLKLDVLLGAKLDRSTVRSKP